MPAYWEGSRLHYEDAVGIIFESRLPGRMAVYRDGRSKSILSDFSRRCIVRREEQLFESMLGAL